MGHLGLICEANLAINMIPTPHGRMFSNVPINLTWEGHDFLGLSKNDAVWNQAKNKVMERAGGLSLDLLKGVLSGLLKKQLEI